VPQEQEQLIKRVASIRYAPFQPTERQKKLIEQQWKRSSFAEESLLVIGVKTLRSVKQLFNT
jgi:hypothetical protein